MAKTTVSNVDSSKILRCIHGIVSLCNEIEKLDELLIHISDLLVEGFQYPQLTSCRILLDEDFLLTRKYEASENAYVKTMFLGGNQFGVILVRFSDSELRFREDEKMMIDITAQSLTQVFENHQNRRIIESKEELFRGFYDAGLVGLAITSPDKGWVLVNDKLCEIVGYEKEELTQMTWADITHPDDLETDVYYFDEVLAGKRDFYEMDKRYIHKEGFVVYIKIAVRVVRKSDGGVDYFLALIEDITPRKRYEHRLEEMYQKFERHSYQIESVMDGIDAFVYVADLKTYELLYVNKYGRDLFGDIQGEICWEALQRHQSGVCSFCTNDKLIDEHGRSTGVYNWVFQNTENKRWYDCRDQAIPWDDGRYVRMEIATDITEIIESRAAFESLTKKLKHSNQELEQFAYIASHDLQEPLRMVASFTQLLQKKYANSLDSEANSYINYAVEGCERMSRLLDDLLRYSCLNTPGLEFEDVDVLKMMEEVKSNLSRSIEESGAVIHYDHLPIMSGVKSQIIQLFQNLIKNAITFRSDRNPVIKIGFVDQDNEFKFSVSDNGIGIEEKHFERVFQIFSRLHSREKYPGNGIGLVLCQKIVRIHHGKIWIESEVGEGTTFYFTIQKMIKNE